MHRGRHFDTEAIRYVIHDSYERKEYPTQEELLQSLKDPEAHVCHYGGFEGKLDLGAKK